MINSTRRDILATGAAATAMAAAPSLTLLAMTKLADNRS